MEQFRDSQREKTDALLRDLGADDVVIEKVTLFIDDDHVKGVVKKLRAFAQENPAVVLGALSALIAGGAVAAGVAVKKSSNKSKRTASGTASKKAARATSTKRKAASKRTLIEPHPGDKRCKERDDREQSPRDAQQVSFRIESHRISLTRPRANSVIAS